MTAADYVRVVAIVGLAVAGCGGSPAGPSTQPPLRVLVVTATAGFRHGSIPVAIQTLQSMAAQSKEFAVTATEDLSQLNGGRLASVDVLMFALTSGELPLGDSQKSAIISFVEGGGGFIGVHSASDTLYNWPDYGRLVGAYLRDHPWTQEATVSVETPSHPAATGLGSSFRLLEEYYRFRDNPRPAVSVILSLDAASVGATGDHPLAWSQPFGGGRSFYTALGHFDGTWRDARFQSHLRGAITWAGKRAG